LSIADAQGERKKDVECKTDIQILRGFLEPHLHLRCRHTPKCAILLKEYTLCRNVTS